MIFSGIVKILGGYNGLYFKAKKHQGNTMMLKLLRMILSGYQREMGSFLPFGVDIKGPINFIHGPISVFISGNSIIGKNVSIYQNVTIGSNMLEDSKNFGSPEIGDNCILGAGCAVIGKVKIGKNCRIAANTTVYKDIPDNSVVVSSAINVIQKDDLVNKIYVNTATGWGYKENGKTVLETDQEIIKQLIEKDPNNPYN